MKCKHGMDERFCSVCRRQQAERDRRTVSVAEPPLPVPLSHDSRNAWWLAVDTDYTSYSELKQRGVIAQGWPRLGNLSRYARMAANPGNRETFESEVGQLALGKYGEDQRERAPKALWRFFQISGGDLVVALEGTTIRGITTAPVSAADGYWHDPEFHYGQCIAKGVRWIDWDPIRIARTPTAPAQSVLAAGQIRNERNLVLIAWTQLTATQDPGPML
jgi:hypothetical protein